MKSIIKWVGRKTQLLPEIDKHLPEFTRTYIEPFMGRMALRLHLGYDHAIYNDYNGELTNFYQVVAYHLPVLKQVLQKMQDHYNDLSSEEQKAYYYEIREQDRQVDYDALSDIDRAARFLFLNRARFNGLYRVNKKNQNNVPWGHKAKLNLFVDEDNLNAVSEYLKKVSIYQGDYRQVLEYVEKDDFVYLDPPYFPVNASSDFTSYTENRFTDEDQIALRDEVLRLTDLGVKVMLSNADVPRLHELYQDDRFHFYPVLANRRVNANGQKRRAVGEIILTNY